MLCSTAARGELVNIRVGNDPAVYKIHKDLLVEYSEFFENALNGSWSESRNGIAHEGVPMVDQRTYKAFHGVREKDKADHASRDLC